MTDATIEQLENKDWGEPNYPSHLVTECHRLRRKPIDEFTVEELRIMIGQNIGFRFLLPRAMDILRDTPVAAGDFFEGDLLLAVTKCEPLQDDQAVALRNEVRAICSNALSELPRVSRDEIEESHGGRPPEEMGLTKQAVELQVQERAEQMLAETPWREFNDFLKDNP